MTVLVVEDDPVQAKMLAGLCVGWGFDVVSADSAEQALNVLCGERRINVVITDLVLPGMDGVDMVAQMRRRPDVTELPTVVLVTAYPDYRKDEVEGLRVPILLKPLSSDDLLRTIKLVTGLGIDKGAQP